MKKDGSVSAWGEPTAGGDTEYGSGGDLSSGIVNIYNNSAAFVALKGDGSVVAWGEFCTDKHPVFRKNPLGFPLINFRLLINAKG
ncbi:hypothetical protein GZ78_11245 [Endozoicomonas numazuensis]|uniref:Uncharacterized protein n=1 Tax=Endozoicomonas numazuensis TaxID=1137799 RepID=A0A081NI57_9GAMM|nr:hypothetical protein GZ78_11245 [Endozoicomonas numazuensis]